MNTQAVLVIVLLFCGVLLAQGSAQRKTDEKSDQGILRLAETARQQTASLLRVREIDLIDRAVTDEHTDVNFALIEREIQLKESEAQEEKTAKEMGAREIDKAKAPKAASDAVKDLNAGGPQESGSAVKALTDKIDADEMREDEREHSAWSPGASSLLPGESLDVPPNKGEAFITGTVRTALARGLPLTPPLPKADEKIGYAIYAPVEIRSLIAMEGLRHGIANYSEIVRFNGRVPEYDPFIVSWKPAWFAAEAVYCKYNPEAKFTNLNGEEQTCKASSGLQSKPRN